MSLELDERVEEMLPAADEPERRTAAAELTDWIADHACAVRAMGPTTLTTAQVWPSRTGRGTSFECSFANRRGELYSLTVATGAGHRLQGRTAQAADPTAAMLAIGALLEELGMLASLA